MASASRPARTALCSVVFSQGQGSIGPAAALLSAGSTGTGPMGISVCISGRAEVGAMWEKAACAPCRIQQQRLAVLTRGWHLRAAQHQVDVDAANDDDAPKP